LTSHVPGPAKPAPGIVSESTRNRSSNRNLATHAPSSSDANSIAPSDGVQSSRIIGNVLMNWLAFTTTIGVGFLMSPFLIRHLGDGVYGVWVLIGSLGGYMGLLDFGITASTIKYIAEHRAKGDQDSINRVITGGLAVFSFVGLLSFAISIAV